MNCLQEYGVQFKIVHTIKCHGICKLVIEVTNPQEEDTSSWEQEIEMYNIDSTIPSNMPSSRYIGIQQYFKRGTLSPHLSGK